MRAAAYLLESLVREGAGHVFVAPHGSGGPMFSDLAALAGMTPVLAASAAMVGCMAEGYARATGRFGVALADGGAGAAGMAVAAGAAREAGSPVFFLTVQAPEASVLAGPDTALLGPVTALSLSVQEACHLPGCLRTCLTRLVAGGGAPVHLALPGAVWRADMDAACWEPLATSLYRPRFVDASAVEGLWRVLVPEGGEPPIRVAILAGAGVEKAGATERLVAFAEHFDIPVAATPRAKGVFPEDHRLSLGIFGPGGHGSALAAFGGNGAEVCIVLGCGLSRPQALSRDATALTGRTLVQVDVDPAAIGRVLRVHVPIVGDCREALSLMLEGGSARVMRLRAGNQSRLAWLRALREAGVARDASGEAASGGTMPMSLHPADVAAVLRRALPRNAAVVVDAGFFHPFFDRYFPAYGPRTYFTAAASAPVGWAVGACLGVKAALGETRVVCVTGEDGMRACGMELATAVRQALPVLFAVLHAGGPGIDFAALARSMGVRGVTVTRPEALAEALVVGLTGEGPCLVDVRGVRREEEL